MQYGSDCGCNAPAPKPTPAINVNVTAKAPTDTIACPDDRCRDYMLGSAPESETATESVLGMHKGRSYVVPMSVMLGAYLKPALNALYRGTDIPVASNYRDIAAVQVVQKENCDKVAIASLATVAKAMMSEVPPAPEGYEADKVLTTDKNGDVYAQDPTDLVANELIEAAIQNCNSGKYSDVSIPTKIFAFGTKCAEFGTASLVNLAIALSKVIPLAPPKELPDVLRGFFGGTEKLYPVTLGKSKSFSSSAPANTAPLASGSFARIAATTLQVPPGLYIATADFTGAAVWSAVAAGYLSYQIVIRKGDASGPAVGGNTTPLYAAAGNYLAVNGPSAGLATTTIVDMPEGGTFYAELIVYSRVGDVFAQAGADKGGINLRVAQISQTTLLVNGVV